MLDLKSPLAKLVFGSVLLVLGLFLFFPIFWMLSTSFKPEGEIFLRSPTLLPKDWTLINYINALSREDIWIYLKNSLITAGSGSLLTTALASYAAFSFAKYRYRGRMAMMYFMLLPPAFLVSGSYEQRLCQWRNSTTIVASPCCIAQF